MHAEDEGEPGRVLALAIYAREGRYDFQPVAEVSGPVTDTLAGIEGLLDVVAEAMAGRCGG